METATIDWYPITTLTIGQAVETKFDHDVVSIENLSVDLDTHSWMVEALVTRDSQVHLNPPLTREFCTLTETHRLPGNPREWVHIKTVRKGSTNYHLFERV